METEPDATDRRGKKRQREIRESQEMEVVAYPVLPPAMDAPESASPGAGGDNLLAQEQPPPEADRGEEEGVDCISGHPDVILGEIVSLLPTKDGARTQILSKRCRPIWRRAPLNLDLFDVSTDCEALIGVVSHIISTHEGPGKLLMIPWYYHHHYPDTVDSWLESRALNNLEEIFFCGSNNGPPRVPPPALPVSMIRFSSCLRVATLNECSLPDDIAETLRFPQLEKLALLQVGISEGSLHSLIAGCPALECLLLDHSHGFHCVRINSVSLISIGVVAGYLQEGLEEIIIQDAPSLKRFLYIQWGPGLRVSVISAPKLETLGCHLRHDDSSRLVFGSTVIQGLHVISSETVVSTIKILAVNMHRLCLDTIIDLMGCFPCLEKLYVQPYYTGGTNSWRRKHGHLIQSFDIHLKKAVLFEYRGIPSQVNFATFFIVNAKELETMGFEGGPDIDNETFVAKQQRKLQLEKKASTGAEFRFITDECYHDISHIKDVHALSRADPFECRYCN